MSNNVRQHYQLYPYPAYPLLASVRSCDTYALNLHALQAAFYAMEPAAAQRILIAGCGSFAPYPFAVANPQAQITALDLSANSLKRARLHCLLHRRFNIRYIEGDLLSHAETGNGYDLIDAYGVLHHMNNPLDGLLSLAGRLTENGIIRVMLYSRYARREEESIRRAFKMLDVHDAATAAALLKRAKPGSRLGEYARYAHEARSTSGVADALLHPLVHTFRVDDLLELISRSGLQLLRFAHPDAILDPDQEIERLRLLERDKQSPGNFIFYLGKRPHAVESGEMYLQLNPCLKEAVSLFRLGRVAVAPRLGHDNPELSWGERRFLRYFITARSTKTLTAEEDELASIYTDTLFLLKYRRSTR